MTRPLLLLVLSTLLPGCPGEEAPLDAPEPMDAPNSDSLDPLDASDAADAMDVGLDVPAELDGGFDADLVEFDGGATDGGFDVGLGDTGIDAPLSDAGSDGGRDAPPPVDGDGDGLLSSVDCDDADLAVGRSDVESCTSSCGAGTRFCTDGVWSPCSASTDCACSTPGAIRTIPCGRCGTASQSCMIGGTWSAPSSCFGERECFAGQVGSMTEMCSLSERFCDSMCMWGDWTVRTPPGECEPGETRRVIGGCVAGTRLERCNSTCGWTAEPCEPAPVTCSRPARTSRTGADPVCIPGGTFILGRDEAGRLYSPERRVYLSEYYIDRYPVTRARYDQCVTAGVCARPVDALYSTFLPDNVAYDTAIDVTQAMAFCVWDGGTLITEFQFEKAARGFEPDRRANAWGTPEGGCTRAPRGVGTACIPYTMRAIPEDYPESVSPFGVRFLGSLYELTSNYYVDYADLPAEVVDPDPPMSAATPYRTMRGTRWSVSSTTMTASALRRSAPVASDQKMFRCAY